ncbi:protein MpMYBL1 [Marchantia polymorpha subsp. ruderalis]|uniref:Myb-like domain-containing protein n=1 Tax=Marchantia polymorpha TaxID=3197 RepID=A0A2R6XBB3_MARPO|nr:hypothetical protein MARPO_0025s0094 [Marchantia polymorpha]BBN03722.1 hypothetical protein Mp_2g25840 [Marchantia polymorpha subsp. ruderalis]|eukprot:PTQ43410.1 hypothetical protein MARPO_0025s0094 [Marchantia polymorpha]
MIGQQKRSLEHSVSPQPTKYQKQFDDNFCETSTRIASSAGEQFDFHELFSGVHSHHASPSPSATRSDSTRSGDKASALDPSDQHREPIVHSEVDQGPQCSACHELPYPSPGYEGCESAEALCTQTCCEEKVDIHKECASFPSDLGNHAQGTIGSVDIFSADNSGPARLHAAEDLSSLHGKSSQKEELLKNAFKSTSLQLGGIECGSSCQEDEGPSTTDAYEMGIEGDRAFVECVRKSMESRRLNGFRPLLVYPSARARIEDFANEGGLDDEKGGKFSLFVGEQFAESDPYQEKVERTMVNDGDLQKRGVCRQISDRFEDQFDKQISRKEKDAGRQHSFYRGGGGQAGQRIQCASTRPGIPNSIQGWEDTQAAQSSDSQLPKNHEGLSSPPRQETTKEVGRNSEELGRASNSALEGNDRSLSSTLIWIKRMALDPGNPHMGEGVEGSGQNAEWVKDCASQAERIRGLFCKRKEEIRLGGAEPHLHQAKQNSTSYYYEELPRSDHPSVERFRASRERVAQYGYPGSPGSHRSFHESSHYLQRGSSPQSQHHWSSQTSQRLPRQSNFHSSYIETAYSDYNNLIERPRKRIPIGSDFQAHVPPEKSVETKSSCQREGPLGDETQSSDEDDEESERWFGKQVWPPPGFNSSSYPDMQVGVGRAISCTCLDPESIDCVRTHVRQEKLRLEREVGQAFYTWKFDEMGECVSDRWTKEEERTFKALVKMNPPSLDKNFWEHLPEAFPGKKMKELVSYYFNVFMLKRRAVQNRLEGRQIDSDDDETELPEGDSEDSEDYDSGEEPDEEADEEVSEAEDDTDQLNESYGGGERSGKLLEHTGFCDLRGVNLVYCSTNMDSLGEGPDSVHTNLCPSSDLNLENEEQDYRSSRREERDVRLHSVQLTTKWTLEQHDEEKHVELPVTVLGEEELQEVKTWEDPHWDEADNDRDVVKQDGDLDATFSGKDDQGALSPIRNNSVQKVIGFDDDQQNSLSSCESEVWVGTMDTAPRKADDKLLSTNGMIQELFGDDSPEAHSPS